ncbi:MAG: hypoxanthine phosphoribosyltransferase [Deltaproteobacteria bacterium]|nr:hypoxanthine phosphoribosyltransferase [Deltaproteobacteria bacterium]
MPSGQFKPLLSPSDIRETVDSLAKKIDEDYAGKTPLLVGVLKGAFVFLSDLAREIKTDVEIDFIQATSYGKRESPSTEVLITGEIGTDVSGRDIIIVEGIIDRGTTARAVFDYLSSKGPASIKFCALLVRDSHSGLNIDYAGRGIGPGFIVGYGMDHMGLHRNLPGIHIVE